MDIFIPNQLNAPGIRGWGRYDNLQSQFTSAQSSSAAARGRAGVHTTFISSTLFVAYPLVAKKFELHDLPLDRKISMDDAKTRI
jgi:hypothetical protein